MPCSFHHSTMMHLTDLSFNANPQIDNPAEALNRHKEGYGYARYIKSYLHLSVVAHLGYEGTLTVDDIRYTFFKRRDKFWHIPSKTLRHLKATKPEIIMSQGMIFPLQVIALRLALGKDTKILIQHH